jgi:type IV pilus assembly protein PilX
MEHMTIPVSAPRRAVPRGSRSRVWRGLRARRSSRAQRGVVLFIALLVMVALSLAGIALIRSADTATIVAGNLAFKQAAAAAVDRSIEQAITALFDPEADLTKSAPVITDKTTHLVAQNYYACVRNAAGTDCLPANDPIPEIPTALTSKATFAAASLNSGLIPVDVGGNASYYVIERMCANPGPPVGTNCNLSAASLGADAGTQHYEGLVRTGDAYYRVTVRVEGPRNTVAYAQAILQ